MNKNIEKLINDIDDMNAGNKETLKKYLITGYYSGKQDGIENISNIVIEAAKETGVSKDFYEIYKTLLEDSLAKYSAQVEEHIEQVTQRG